MRHTDREHRARRFVLRSFLFFMVALCLPLFGGAVFFSFQVRSIEASVLEANAYTLSLIREIVDSASSRIDRALTDIRRDPALQPLLTMQYPFDATRITEVADAHRFGLISKVDDPFLVDIFVYFSSPRILFTRSQVFFDTRRFYGAFFDEPGLDHDEWLATFALPTHHAPQMVYRDIIYHGVARSVLEVRYPLPMTPRIRSQGVVAALIDRKAIGQLIAEHVRPQGGFAVIAGQARSVIVEVSSPESGGIAAHVLEAIPDDRPRGVEFLEWDGVPMAVAYERSPTFGWLVVMGVPRHLFFEQSRRITTLFIIVAVIVLSFGVPIALLLALRTSRPLVAIAGLLSEGVVRSTPRALPEDPRGLDPLSESVYELTQRHASLRRLLDEQRPLVRQVVVDRLLRGDFPTENELHATLRHYELEVSAPSFGVFCVMIDGYYDEANDEIVHEFVVKSTLVKEQLDAVLPLGSLTHGVSLNRLAAVVRLNRKLDEGADQELGEVVDRVSRILNARDAIRCFVIQGAPVARLFDVPESFRAAISMMHSMRADGSVNTIDRESCYYYPPDLESRLVTFVQTGRVEELDGLVRTIRNENLSKRCLSVPMLKGLADEIEGTRNKIMASLEEQPDHPWPACATDLSIQEYVSSQLDGLLGIARLLADQDRQHQKHRRAILEFIKDHYTEASMGLKRLSREFSLSEVYLSYLFRQIAGTTFSSYLEQLRMNEAADLLRSSRMTVDEIARGVGYASADVFRRAFKRRYGVSPSSFAGAAGEPSGLQASRNRRDAG